MNGNVSSRVHSRFGQPFGSNRAWTREHGVNVIHTGRLGHALKLLGAAWCSWVLDIEIHMELKLSDTTLNLDVESNRGQWVDKWVYEG